MLISCFTLASPFPESNVGLSYGRWLGYNALRFPRPHSRGLGEGFKPEARKASRKKRHRNSTKQPTKNQTKQNQHHHHHHHHQSQPNKNKQTNPQTKRPQKHHHPTTNQPTNQPTTHPPTRPTHTETHPHTSSTPLTGPRRQVPSASSVMTAEAKLQASTAADSSGATACGREGRGFRRSVGPAGWTRNPGERA